MGAVNCHGTTTCTRKIVIRVVNPGAGSIPPHVPILHKNKSIDGMTGVTDMIMRR
jgi:hypothetical protein